MIIRLSQKLCTKIKAGALSDIPLHESLIAESLSHRINE